ncbi:thiamin pyrophosphokinase 1-like [Octopus vulgaris]|uniref:Thiamin pyrophosphokinase 1-like n=2 Tax=Octopus TaxID=6643 RepID=A0AA36F0X3_OCTVU|nr:thiamin pyrophosphokinase 1 [Octopus sinensis]CAI9719480.1 thiamin pyrophosphokinase 1-like [Octopus vulgaris]
MSQVTEWTPLAPLHDFYDEKIVLILLNQPITPMLKIFKYLWQKAVLKVFVDGAANEVYSHLSKEDFLPDIITGDFDSIRPEVKEHYQQKNVEIVETPDQDETDFTKCLRIVFGKINHVEVERIVVLVGFQGRVDQQFANFNTLFKVRNFGYDKYVPIYVMSNSDLTCLLKTGNNSIEVDSEFRGAHCGLIPLGCVCNSITTTGLKWNLDKAPLEFGHLVSTSNTYAENLVEVQTECPILWCMDLKF